MTPGQKNNLKRLFKPKSIAFIGGNSAALAVEQCLRSEFDGDIWCVNPKRPDMHGVRCYPTVDDLPGAPDATFLAVPGAHALVTIESLRRIGAGGVAGYTAGFSESGEDGARQERALVQAAGDMALIGPNCSGVLSYAHNAILWPFDHNAHPPGPGVALISQSGMLGNTFTMNQRSLPLSYVVSSGNQAMFGVEDFLELFIDDPMVTAIGLYIEGLRDIQRFADIALAALEKGKPIVAFKAGASDVGAQLTMTHTGSLSGTDDQYNALFERIGVVRVASPVLLLETLKMLTVAGAPEGRRLAAFTCSGGDSAMVADAAEALGFSLPQPTASTANKMRTVLPPIATVANPLDYTTPLWGNEDGVEQVVAAMLTDEYDAALIVQDYPIHNPGESYAPYLADARAFTRATRSKGIPAAVCSVLPEDIDAQTRLELIQSGIAPLQGVNDAVAAMAASARFGELRKKLREGMKAESRRLVPLTQPLETAHILDEWQGKKLLAKAGLTIPESQMCTAENLGDVAEVLGYPVAIKMVSANLPHKTEAGAVKLGICSRQDAVNACSAIRSSAKAYDPKAVTERFLVERMIDGSVAEFIVGITRDPQFGPVLVVGSGGILVELMADAETLLLPASRQMISDAIDRLSVSRLLGGFRGGAAGNRDAVIDAIEAVSRFAVSAGSQLSELDINPLMVTPDGAFVADALIRGSFEATD